MHPSVSQPSESFEPEVQSECEQEPCGGALLMAVHVPLVHVSDVAHALPHVPQLLLSVCVSTHDPEQSVPVPHWHALLTHVAPLGHALPHVPQLDESLVVSTHIPPHTVPVHGFIIEPLSCCCGGGGGGGGFVMGPLSLVG